MGDLARIADGFTDARADRAVKQGYLRFFAGAERVLDVGCGRGTFLDLLRENGIDATGIEASEAAHDACRARGHRVLDGDALEVVTGLGAGGERFDGVLLCHVVEHLEPARVTALLGAIGAVLPPGGHLVIVTPNARNLIVATELFWLDPTHVRPYPRALLERLGTAQGLATVESFDDPATTPRRPPLARLLARVRSALSGADRSSPLDSIVVMAGRASCGFSGTQS